MSLTERIEIARKAIMLIRRDKKNWPTPKEKYPLTYGCYGLLDYIEFGDPDKIMDYNLRLAIQKVLQGSSDSQQSEVSGT